MRWMVMDVGLNVWLEWTYLMDGYHDRDVQVAG